MAGVVQKMAGELTLEAQNSPILAFFDFLVSEGCLGCSEQASKTLGEGSFFHLMLQSNNKKGGGWVRPKSGKKLFFCNNGGKKCFSA